VKKLKGEEIPAQYTYNPTVVTPYNLDQHR
jgi:hypothetical protein